MSSDSPMKYGDLPKAKGIFHNKSIILMMLPMEGVKSAGTLPDKSVRVRSVDEVFHGVSRRVESSTEREA